METSRRQAARRAADYGGGCARNPLAADAPVPPWTLENGAVLRARRAGSGSAATVAWGDGCAPSVTALRCGFDGWMMEGCAGTLGVQRWTCGGGMGDRREGVGAAVTCLRNQCMVWDEDSEGFDPCLL